MPSRKAVGTEQLPFVNHPKVVMTADDRKVQAVTQRSIIRCEDLTANGKISKDGYAAFL